ncbi:glycosyltransferase family 1 protein [Corynebacterium sp. ACRPH]|uniref:glycosyltransferase family 4 protein n=1 Tax=Corynebacterium sp. ACRPH TaxID=2918199 RepID=UPI001EF17074|nr:glycosyltransferase family 1 protein [Corynebacterium sp. ACRPH]MCG7455921.1 glycosyltransferase family 1 protein [Corynebacterium sp. ACRPH]
MRVAIVAESFLPNVNGVVNSVLRVLEHLRANGHEALVIAPGATNGQEEIATYEGYRIARVPAVDVPGINSLPIGVPMPSVYTELKKFQPDVVHLASPFVLGGAGAVAARALKLPCVAIFQTDVAGFANNYRMKLLSKMAWRWVRVMHNMCAMTLAPSSVTMRELEENRVRGVAHWGRGVDTERFHPSKRSDELRREWLLEGEKKRGNAGEAADLEGRRTIVGFVGRLAAEKSVERMAALNGRDDVQLVIVGDGPEMEDLKSRMPTAVFTGGLYGEDLAHAFASLDIFVHTGQYETFCQAIQEAQASRVATIGPAAGGPIDLIKPGHNGYLLNVENFESELVEAVDTILAGDVDTYRDNAFEGVQNKSWSSLCDQLLGYYRQAIAQGGKAAPRKGSQRDFTGVREVPRPAAEETTAQATVETSAKPAPQVSAESTADSAAQVGTEPVAK